jgi:hypothetical protein
LWPRPTTERIDMDEKALTEALKSAAADLVDAEVYDWPFEADADKAFYVETEDHKRYGVRVEEIARFQVGNTYF